MLDGMLLRICEYPTRSMSLSWKTALVGESFPNLVQLADSGNGFVIEFIYRTNETHIDMGMEA